MTNYFSLPLELRQKILFDAIAVAEGTDKLALHQFSPLFESGPAYRIYKFGKVANNDESAEDIEVKRVLPLHYLPSVANLIDSLVDAHVIIKADLAYVVNKSADKKKMEPNVKWLRPGGWTSPPFDHIPIMWIAWTLGQTNGPKYREGRRYRVPWGDWVATIREQEGRTVR